MERYRRRESSVESGCIWQGSQCAVSRSLAGTNFPSQKPQTLANRLICLIYAETEIFSATDEDPFNPLRISKYSDFCPAANKSAP